VTETARAADFTALDGQRFEELYDEHWPWVFAVCRTRLGDHQDALDAAQEVFVRKWRARGRYDPGLATFRTWVSRNAEHLCTDIFRRKAVRPTQEPLTETLPDAPAAGETDAEIARRVTLNSALDALEPQQRQLVLMHEVHGYTWEEIAHTTGLTVAQARSAVGKGLERLRALLKDAGVEFDA